MSNYCVAPTSEGQPPKPNKLLAPPPARIEVRLAKDPDGTAIDPPAGLHVYLALPGDALAMKWEEFVVVASGSQFFLDPVSPPSPPTIDPRARKPLWCVWSATTLAPGQTFRKVNGFGYPLLARFRGSRLVLPNTREVNVIYYNLSGQPHNPTNASDHIVASHRAAASLYEELHIRLKFTQGTPKPGMAREHNVLRGSTGAIGLFDAGNAPVATDFSDPQWGLPRAPKDLAATIAVYWINEIRTGNVEGFAFPFLHLLDVMGDSGQSWTLPPCASIVFPFTFKVVPTQALAHELGHCLLYDPGLGRQFIEGPQASARGAKDKVLVWLSKLGLEGPSPGNPPGANAYIHLPWGRHSGGTNLMAGSGGVDLLDWQVAIMRAAKQVGDLP